MAVNGVSTLGNRTFLFGGASGIDTSALITAAYNQRKAEADKIDIKVQKNTAKYDAYEKIQTLSLAVQKSLTNIKKNYSSLATTNGLFDQRTGALSSSSNSNLTNLISASIDPGTELGTYELEVVSKAKVHKVGSASTFTDTASDLGYAGSFDIAIAGKTAGTINVTADMSLSELATAINSQSTTTGVKASVIQTTATNYQLVLSGTDTAKDIAVTGITGTDVLQSIGVLDSGGAFDNPIQASSQAQLNIDGVSYFRDTNNFDDIIPGVNLTVKNSEPGTTIDLDIENDNSGVKDGIMEFIDAYNALRDYIKTQQSLSASGDVADDAVLFGDTLMGTVSSNIQSVLGQSFGEGGSVMSTLREIGITLDLDNKLVMDEDKFDTALLEKFDEVKGIFTASYTSDNTNLRMISNTSTLPTSAFALDITYSGGAITDVSIGGNNALFDISGQTITGKAGTAYAGMVFAYVGTASATVNIDFTQGFADMMDSVVDNYADILTGSLHNEMLSLSDQNTEMEARSTRVIERADDFRERLIDRYAGLEAKMAAAQSVLAQLQAILGTNNNDN
jgi:flagellar hook-associated protein 2